jgi:tight adherence protein C
MGEILQQYLTVRFAISALTAIAVVATMITLATPFLGDDRLAKRMKGVSSERERIRLRERASLKPQQGRPLRAQPKAYMKNIVDRFSLSRWLDTEDARAQLAMAGFRGPQAEIGFLFSRAAAPIAFIVGTLVYFYLFDTSEKDMVTVVGSVLVAGLAGIKAPEFYLKNAASKRQTSMRRAFPDALDLILICVEAGMSIEMAFRKVGEEIGSQSVPLAEEFGLATAELSYLPDRRQAYANLSARTGLDGVRQVATVLSQAEKYGTPLGHALRTTARESRDQRMMEAEKIAAALPPKLTVPMIVFFLPVLMAVVMGPAIIQVFMVT